CKLTQQPCQGFCDGGHASLRSGSLAAPYMTASLAWTATARLEPAGAATKIRSTTIDDRPPARIVRRVLARMAGELDRGGAVVQSHGKACVHLGHCVLSGHRSGRRGAADAVGGAAAAHAAALACRLRRRHGAGASDVG